MTGKALSVLATDPDGFFLMVEGGNIDPAATDNDYADMTRDVLAFDEAVKTAIAFAGTHPDTLVIVTADHETGGLTLQTSTDGTLTFTFTRSGHTAANVPIRASGPGAERFGGVTVPNTQVFTVMEDAMGLAPAAPAPIPTPAPANGMVTVPGRIQAEDYNYGGEGVAYHDTTPGNEGGAYRNDDVDIEAAGGITNVGWIRDGEWLSYTATVGQSGTYIMTASVASPNSGRTAALSVGGSQAATIAVPNTGSFSAFTTVSVPVTLPAGVHTLTLAFSGDGQNLDWIDFAASGAGPAAAPRPAP
jgi:hypothetical protein